MSEIDASHSEIVSVGVNTHLYWKEKKGGGGERGDLTSLLGVINRRGIMS